MKVEERTKNSGVTPTEATRALAGAGAGNRHTHTHRKKQKQTAIATYLSPPKPICESRTRFILSPEPNDDKKKEDNAGERERRRKKKREGSLNKHEHSGRRSRYTPVLFFL